MFCRYSIRYDLPSIQEFEHMLPCKKTKAYLEMEAECKLASLEKNPGKEIPVVNSKIPKRSKGRIFRHEPKIRCFIGHTITQQPM